MTELSPFGISAVGEGIAEGNAVRVAYQAADGSTGEANLQIVDDSTLEGMFTNYAYGTTPARMTR